MVSSFIDRAVGNPRVAAFLNGLVADAFGVLSDPAELKKFFKLTAKEAFAKVLKKARELLAILSGELVRDETLRGIVEAGLSAGAYVCRHGSCKLPTSDVRVLRAQILDGWKR
jgi:hypothetical protein